ncbi:hypothetical protein [Myxococcus phage Mx1]|nr:hypothetical protein [Myxococcus phage Mx1]
MAFTYDITPRGVDVHDTSPYWFAAFIRFKHRDTFTRTKMSVSPEVSSRDGAEAFPVEEDYELLIADTDISAWTVQSGKTSHTSQCQLSMTSVYNNYVAELAPGDWMGFWAFNNRGDYERVKKLVIAKQRCNAFNDGLKFLGRVESVRRTRVRQPMGGLSVSYSVTGTGFGEFDSYIYYNPIIKARYTTALQWMMDFGGSANDLILGTSLKKGIITSQDVLPKLISICLGVGPFSGNNSIPTGQLDISDDYRGSVPGSLQGTPNRGYLIPATVGAWMLGSDTSSVKDAGLSYADLLRGYVGIQRYWSSIGTPDQPWQGFIPDYATIERNTYLMRQDLTGEFRILTMHFDQRSVWSLLQTYVNEPVDEMFTAMRVDHTGHVMPSLIVRQTPFTTDWYADRTKWDVTPFTELPRWRIDSDLVVQEETGRSNALRFNYLHLVGQDLTGTNTENNGILNYVRNPPIVDAADINRSGLRMYMKQLSANVNEGQYNNDTSPGAKWQEFLADIFMGGHLKYTGTLTCKGIQEPICEGDNVEVEDVIYHIERVVHSGQISMFGQKDFTTILYVTNGIRADVLDPDVEVEYPDLDVRDDEDASIVED